MALGMVDELDLLLALEIDGLIRERAHSNRAGQSHVQGMVRVLELYERYALAEAYLAYVAGLEWYSDKLPAPGSKVSPSAVVGVLQSGAEQVIDMGQYAIAVKILKRALKKAEALGYPETLAAVLSRLARAYDENGDLALAVSTSRRVLKVARQHGIKIEDLPFTGMEEIIASGASGRNADADVASAVLTKLARETAKACDGTEPNPALLPELPYEKLVGDPVLSAQFVRGEATGAYLACFNRHRSEVTGMATSPTNTMQPETLRDVAFLLALAGDRESAEDLLAFLVDKARWTSDPNFRWWRYAAVTQTLEGLVAGKRKAWARPHAAALVEALKGRDYLAAVRAGKDTWRAAELGLVLFTLGESEFRDALYAAVDAGLKKNDTFGPTRGCGFSLSECEFSAVMEEARGDERLADHYYGGISSAFSIMWSGASMDPHEMDELQNRAMATGARHEATGRHRLAATYYAYAGASVESFMRSEAPLRSLDDIRAADAFSRVAYKSGDLDGARKVTGRLIGAVRDRMDSLSSFGSDLLVRWSQRLRGVFETHINTAPLRADGTVEAGADEFLAMQYLQATRTAVTFTRMSARMSRNGGKLAREHQDASDALASAYNRLGSAKKNEAKRLLGEIGELEAKLSGLEEKLRKENPAYFEHGRLQFTTREELRGLLRDGEAVLSTFSGDDHAFLWLITREGDALRRLDVRPDALERTIGSLRQRIGAESAVPDVKALVKVPLLQFYQLYRTVFGSFGDALDGVEELIFIPHGAFDGMPITTLLTERPPKPSMNIGELRDSHLPWLVRKMAIGIMPSLGAIKVLRAKPSRSAAQRAFLGIGNPSFGAGLHVASAPTRAADPRLVEMSALPETETEVTRLAEILGADAERDLLLAGAASETRIRGTTLDDYRIIAFATHGLIAGEVRGIDEPALVLTKPENATRRDDGLLKASEVIDLRLDADLVLLSACNTASGDGTPGAEGLSGLANAFFYAGARNLMVTHWYIPSSAAVDITVGLMEERKAEPGLGWAQALRRSILRLIDGEGPEIKAHPLSWGAHMVVGVAE